MLCGTYQLSSLTAVHVNFASEKLLVFLLLVVAPYKVLSDDQPSVPYILSGPEHNQSASTHAEPLYKIHHFGRLLKNSFGVRVVLLLAQNNIGVNIRMHVLGVDLFIALLGDPNQTVLLCFYEEGVRVLVIVVGLTAEIHVRLNPGDLLASFQPPLLEDRSAVVQMLCPAPQKHEALLPYHLLDRNAHDLLQGPVLRFLKALLYAMK